MKVVLERVSWRDWRPWRARSGNVDGSLAWSYVDNAGVHHVVVRRGAERWLTGLARVGHELEHALDPGFTNEKHHQAIHFCLRAYFPVRTWDHALLATPALAQRLVRDGRLEVLVDQDGAHVVEPKEESP